MINLVKIIFAVAICSCILPISFGQIHGTISSNPTGGQDVSVVASKQFGEPDHNIGAGVFAAGNTKSGTAGATGGFVNYNIKDHALSVSKTFTPNSETFSQNARINLMNDQINKLDTNLQHSRTNLNNGFAFDKYRGSLDFNNVRGHGASVGVSNIPQIGSTTVDLMGKANLWTSANRATTLDAIGTASRSFGGYFDGKKDYSLGIGLNHRFRK